MLLDRWQGQGMDLSKRLFQEMDPLEWDMKHFDRIFPGLVEKCMENGAQWWQQYLASEKAVENSQATPPASQPSFPRPRV